MGEADHHLDHRWIDRPELLGEMAAELERTEVLALDTESNSMFAYRERLCLVQLNLVGRTPALYAIDPLAVGEKRALEPLVAWLSRGIGARRVLMHGGEYDVAVLKREVGIAPTNLFDTQAAAAMLGLAKTGYANLVAAFLDVTLSKEHQQFDWARRPVPAGPKKYALDDVRYLPTLAARLEAHVREADLEEEVAIACAAVASAAPHEGMTEAERFWRVAGGERLSAEVLGRLASLVAWREREAEARDQPPGRLVPKEALIQLARRGAASVKELEGLGMPRRLVSERADALLAALATPAAVPEKPRRPFVDPKVESRRTRLKAWREEEAKRRGVVAQAVLPTRALEAIAGGDVALEEVPQLGPKRVRMYGEVLERLGR